MVKRALRYLGVESRKLLPPPELGYEGKRMELLQLRS